MRRLMKIAILVIVLQVVCTGCWDHRDINTLAIITVIGFDKITAEDGVDQWQVSAYLMQAGKAGGETGGSAGGQEGRPEIILKGKGLTISEAILDFIKRSPRIPFFSDAYSVILGERVAQEELLVVIDYLNRLREQRPGAFVMVVKGAASEIFEAEPEASISVSRELKDQSQNVADAKGIAKGITLIDFTADLLSTDRDPVASQIRQIQTEEKRGEKLAGPPKTTLVEGLGIFKDDKLVGWLNAEETIGYNLLTSKIREGDVLIPVEKDGKGFVFLIEKSKPKIKAKLTDDKLNIKVEIEPSGRITENDDVNLAPSDIGAVELAVSEKIGAMVMHTIETVRGYESDCLGFSEELHHSSSKDWKKVKEHWRETFLDANVEVEVRAKVENTGRLGQKLEMSK